MLRVTFDMQCNTYSYVLHVRITLHVTCYVIFVTCFMLCGRCYVFHVTYYMLCVICNVLHITFQTLRVTYYTLHLVCYILFILHIK